MLINRHCDIDDGLILTNLPPEGSTLTTREAKESCSNLSVFIENIELQLNQKDEEIAQLRDASDDNFRQWQAHASLVYGRQLTQLRDEKDEEIRTLREQHDAELFKMRSISEKTRDILWKRNKQIEDLVKDKDTRDTQFERIIRLQDELNQTKTTVKAAENKVKQVAEAAKRLASSSLQDLGSKFEELNEVIDHQGK